MSEVNRNRRRTSARQERHITVRAVRRDPPDLRKLSRAIIALAMAQAEAEAQHAGAANTATDTASAGGESDGR
jgi:hypothetical protein